MQDQSQQPISAQSVVAALLRRDLTLALRAGGGWFHALVFFIFFAGLSVLAFGPSPQMLQLAAPGVLWLAACLAVQYGTADCFLSDLREGFLLQFRAEHGALWPLILARALSLCATTGLAILLAAPLAALMLALDLTTGLALAALLALGMPGLLATGLFGAALVTGWRHSGIMAVILSVPLQMPILIFGVLASKNVISESGNAGLIALVFSAEGLLLTALSLGAMAVLPVAIIAALRMSIE